MFLFKLKPDFDENKNKEMTTIEFILLKYLSTTFEYVIVHKVVYSTMTVQTLVPLYENIQVFYLIYKVQRLSVYMLKTINLKHN